MEKKSAGVTCRVAAVFLLVLVLCTYATASTDELLDCCLSTKNKPIPFSILKDYSIQAVSGGCQIPATVFITKKDLRLCAPPRNRSKWVAKLIKKLDKKDKQRQKRGRKN
ncbi:hypothetical protein GJAV_G00047720 [Gymnothorax javanicus]|nr:hypothetical protein GJAV_G00047720 [Gymnothorax javanicus]